MNLLVSVVAPVNLARRHGDDDFVESGSFSFVNSHGERRSNWEDFPKLNSGRGEAVTSVNRNESLVDFAISCLALGPVISAGHNGDNGCAAVAPVFCQGHFGSDALPHTLPVVRVLGDLYVDCQRRLIEGDDSPRTGRSHGSPQGLLVFRIELKGMIVERRAIHHSKLL